MENVSMILSSCDSYEDAWAPFCHQLKQNWPNFSLSLYLGTESKTFHFEGLNINCPLAGGPQYKSWSKRLLKLLENIESEFVIFMLDDFWLTEKVDESKISKVLQFMKENKRAGFVCLKNEEKKWCKIPKSQRRIDIKDSLLVECTKKEPFRITTQGGIWRKKYLKKILRGHESAWAFESRANWRSEFYRYKIYGVRESIFVYPVGGFFWGGKCYREYINLYDNKLIEKSIDKRGLISFNDLRSYPKSKNKVKDAYDKFLSILPKW